MIINIIALNTLIAIIGDSFDKVQEDKNSYDGLMKVGLLDEINELLMLTNWDQDKPCEMAYIIIVKYASYDEVDTTEWTGKIKKMTKVVVDGMAKIE